MNQRKPTRQWRRWHRWLGLAVALPVLVLSVTGVLLNHIDSFGSVSYTHLTLPTSDLV